MMDFIVNWLVSVPVFVVPFAFATLGLIICEKSGVLNLGSEGFMLIGALIGIGASLTLKDWPLVAILIGASSGALLALLFCFLVVTLRVNQVIAGLTMVLLSSGLTSLIATRNGWTNQAVMGLPKIEIPLLSEIPLIGRFLFQQDILVYTMIPIFALVTYATYHREVGLRLRAVGENPDAAESAGINISFYRYGAVIIGCTFVSLAGAYLAVSASKIWVDGMVQGRGWIAIALVIFARWQYWRALLGAFVFGGIEALIPRVAAAGIPIPQYFFLSLPYIVTLCVMIWANMGSGALQKAPGALGRPYITEERN